MSNDICARLAASLRYDVINGNQMERNILKSQIRDAISTIESLESENIAGQLEWLKEQGCHPSIYRRGNLWRVHINMAGNWWEEHESLSKAVNMAIDTWVKGGKMMDGLASQDI